MKKFEKILFSLITWLSSCWIKFRGEIALQQRLYHQHIARSVRRYRHIYGDSLLASIKAPLSEERQKSKSTIQQRRSSADEALVPQDVSKKVESPSPQELTTKTPPPIELEHRRRRRHFFTMHRTMPHEPSLSAVESIPIATVIVALETDENTVSSIFFKQKFEIFILRK